jgi:lipopolysaccharide heptosyltransferase I
MNRFLIIRLSSLGDIIHTLPAFSALRTAHMEAEITWLVEEKGRKILDLVPGIDRIVEVRSKRWKWRSSEFRAEITRIKNEIRCKDQTAIDFQGLVKSAYFARLSRSRRRLGFHRCNLREPLASRFYTEQAAPFSEEDHVIRKNLGLLENLGIHNEKFVFPLKIPEGLTTYVTEKLHPLGYTAQKKLIVINVGAAWETKRWPAAKWAATIEKMTADGLFSLLLWGDEKERALAQEIAQRSSAVPAPFFNLKEVLALLQSTDLLVSGDTFALQAACALRRPVVALFGPTNPRRNGPFSKEDEVAFHEVECSYCYKRTCSDPKCLEKIEPDEVAALCRQRLEGGV